MIYITGDTHGEKGRFRLLDQEGADEWTCEDYLIICGDFGYIYADDEDEHTFLDQLEKLPYTICFSDGNHENFPAIYRYPCEEWMGGRIHRIRKNIVHLMRGQVYTIEGKKFFTMGGAYSIDRYMRIEKRSWWKEELPSDAEYREASAALKEHGFKVDYIVTHTAPAQIIRSMRRDPNGHEFHAPDRHDAELTGFLEWIMYEVEFKRWFFGHWHTDEVIFGKFRALWFDVEKIE